MLTKKILEKYDTKSMHKVYDKWPEIAQNQFQQTSPNFDFGKISHVVFAGMGGSGAIGDIFSSILSKTDTHVDVIKGYVLPKTVNSESLVITTSISGNTEETLNILSLAAKQDCKLISFSSGGKMEKFCARRKINHTKIEMIHSPRTSFPVFLYGILSALQPFLPVEKKDILDSIKNLKRRKDEISSASLDEKNPSLSLASWLNDIPLVYYPRGLESAAIRFKNSLQENAKMHGIAEDIIEACHNGIVSWERKSIVRPILIQGKDDNVKTKERWKVVKEYLRSNDIDYKEIISIKGNILSKLIDLIYLLDYSTIYRSCLAKTDPTPVKSIDFIKNKISS